MFSLTIVFGPGPTAWQLLFKNGDAAEIAKASLYTKDGINDISIYDDFGHIASVSKNSLHGVMLEDMELSKMAHVELALHQARTQSKAQTMAQADPALRMSQGMNGPAMLSPMGRG